MADGKFNGKYFIDSEGLRALVGKIGESFNDLKGQITTINQYNPTLTNTVDDEEKKITINYKTLAGTSASTEINLKSMLDEYLTTDRFLKGVDVKDTTKLVFTFAVATSDNSDGEEDEQTIEVDLADLVDIYTAESASDYFTLEVEDNNIVLNVTEDFEDLCTEVAQLRTDLTTVQNAINGTGGVNSKITALEGRVSTNEINIQTLRDDVDSIQIMSAQEVAALWNVGD